MLHNKIRFCDEYQCAKCGKSWGVADVDVPGCIGDGVINYPLPFKIEMLESQIYGLMLMFREYCDTNDERLRWNPRQWHTYMQTMRTRTMTGNQPPREPEPIEPSKQTDNGE